MRKPPRINAIYSLRAQIYLGSLVLLTLAISSISYALIIRQKAVLRKQIQMNLILQGRNIALVSKKMLLREDPEFDLYPMIKRVTSSENNIASLIITNAAGIIVGDKNLGAISKKYQNNIAGYRELSLSILAEGETLFENGSRFLFTTSVYSSGKLSGKVHLTYSKLDYHKAVKNSLLITVILSSAALLLSFLLSVTIFKRISRPLDDLVDGVNMFAKGKLNKIITLKAKNEFRVLADSFNSMAAEIAAAQKDLIKKERMERELELAHDIQATLIPRELPQPSGYELATFYQSATEVGGDYYDVIQIDPTKYALVMADVSGKGVPGMVIMAMVKALVQEYSSQVVSPKELIMMLNRSLNKYIRRHMFITFYYSILDTETGLYTFSNAGHNPLMIYDNTKDGCTFLKMQGMPLGIIPDNIFAPQLKDYTISLNPRDLVLQYTDGLNESHNRNNDLFGAHRILSACNSHAFDGASTLVQNLVQAEKAFRDELPQADDITLLALSRTPMKQKAHI